MQLSNQTYENDPKHSRYTLAYLIHTISVVLVLLDQQIFCERRLVVINKKIAKKATKG
jgi:hypothetical protein